MSPRSAIISFLILFNWTQTAKQRSPAFVSAILAELLQACSQLSISGDLTVCGTISPTVAQGATGPQGATGAVGPQGPFGSPCCNNYVYAYRTTSFAPAGTGLIPIDTNGPIDGWTHTPGTTIFTCNQTGRYRITYDGQATLRIPPFGASTMQIQALKNSVLIGGSNSEQSYYVIISPVSQIRTFSKTFIIDVAASDEIEFQMLSNNRVSLLPATVGSTVAPAFSVSITRVE